MHKHPHRRTLPLHNERPGDGAAATLQRAKRLEALVEHALDAMLILDADGNIRFVNRAAMDLGGYSESELLGRHYVDLVHPDDLTRAVASFSNLVRSGDVIEVVARYRHKDGSWRVIECRNKNCLADPDIRGVVVTTRDVTERVDARRALRATEERHRSLVAAMAEGVVLQDAGGRIIMCNESAERLLDLTQAQLLGSRPETRDWYVIHDDGSPFPFRDFPSTVTVRTGVPQSDVVMGICTPAGTRWLSVNTQPLLHADARRPYAVVSSFHDVTHRREVTEALRRSSEEISDLYHHAPCGYHSLDERGVFVRINDTELSWLGYSREEVIGKICFADLLTETGRAAFHAAFPLFRQSGHVRNLEFELVRRDGSTFPVLASATAIRDEQGRFLMSRSTLHDITERKRAEDEVRRLNEELEQRVQQRTAELSQAISELETFSYSVSHDLRAPVRTIAGFGVLLKEQCGPQLDPSSNLLLDRLLAANRRQTEIIDDLLNLASAGRQQMLRRPLDLSVLANSVAETLAVQSPERRVQMTIQPGITVWADPGLMLIVMENLLGNAWKFTVRSARPRIEVGMLHTGDDRTVFVRDNGIGFDMQHAARLFNPFQRLHRSDEFEGSGIGLATVRRIVERHGGRIWADSSPDQGATVYFTLGRRRGMP